MYFTTYGSRAKTSNIQILIKSRNSFVNKLKSEILNSGVQKLSFIFPKKQIISYVTFRSLRLIISTTVARKGIAVGAIL